MTQVRAVGAWADYSYRAFGNVMVFEFFMPLTNETALRGTLDSLFYDETILRKLRGWEMQDLQQQIGRTRAKRMRNTSTASAPGAPSGSLRIP